jgi:hypothetical protein
VFRAAGFLGTRRCWIILLSTMTLILMGGGRVRAQEERARSGEALASGWHPWYELKVDPENASNLIACGSRWDVAGNALFGFVYASADSGKTWRKAMEDRHSTWVSEQSCAFGSKHTAYFVSEASKVIDGEAEHHLGRTRLYVSADGGQHWEESIETGWADYSSSAVSSRTGNVYTFFNYGDLLDQDKGTGTTVGLLVFSPEQKTVSGPFVAPGMAELNYRGTYPSNAVALKDGSVVTLYLGSRPTADGPEQILGSERVSSSTSPSPSFTVIAKSGGQTKRNCLGLEDYSLAHDENDDRLVVIFHDLRDNACRVVLAVSEDGAKTWSKGAPLVALGGEEVSVVRPSLAAGAHGVLGLLWSHDKKWFFSTVKGTALTRPPVELHVARETAGIVPDSLMSVFNQLRGFQPDMAATAGVRLNVRSRPNWIWRPGGLVAAGDRFVGVFASIDEDGDNFYSMDFKPGSTPAEVSGGQAPSQDGSEFDATRNVALLYGGAQSFDNATGTLSLDVKLANRGSHAIFTPICLEAKDVSSKIGTIKVLNADNGLTGSGAVWDLTRSVSGNQVPPGATTYTSFTLKFHIDLASPRMVVTRDVLDLTARVWARSVSEGPAKGKIGASAKSECP